MILEIATLDLKPGEETAFEAHFQEAYPYLIRAQGYLSYQLQHCLEKPNRYVLMIQWKTVEDHLEGFRNSLDYQEWRRLLHSHYLPSPQVEHFRLVSEQTAEAGSR